jgi:cell division protein FtsB
MSDVDKILAGVCTALVVVLALLGWRYEATLAAFEKFKAQVSAESEKAATAQDALRAAHEKTLEDVKNDYERRLDTVRAGAAARLAARVRDVGTGRGAVRADAERQQVDDDAERKRLVDSTLRAAAEDALKLAAWQAWCVKNGCPIEE